MSEYEDNRKRTMDVNVTVSRNEEIEALNLELAKAKLEKQELEATLTTLAEKELKRQSEILHCEATVEAVKQAKLRQGSTALLSSQENDNDSGFDSEEEAILAINKAKKSGNPKSAEIEAKLAKKFLEKPVNLEFEGNLKDLARKPQKSGNETPEQYEQRVNEQKLKQSAKWRNLNFDKSDGD
jgi:hypothetical protein